MLSHAASMDTETDKLQLDSVVSGHHVDYIKIYGVVRAGIYA